VPGAVYGTTSTSGITRTYPSVKSYTQQSPDLAKSRPVVRERPRARRNEE
jgi:hypothetical protein